MPSDFNSSEISRNRLTKSLRTTIQTGLALVCLGSSVLMTGCGSPSINTYEPYFNAPNYSSALAQPPLFSQNDFCPPPAYCPPPRL